MIQGNIPTHVAIMMDGNGRWAKARNKNRSAGHTEGAKTFESIVRAADEFHVKISYGICIFYRELEASRRRSVWTF